MIGVLLLLVVLLIVAWRFRSGTRQPTVDVQSSRYAEMVSAFYSGVTALDVDDAEHPAAFFTKATQLYPDEPASWANLGLFALRSGDLDAASRDLDKARALAPQSAEVEMLQGLLQEQRGAFSAAIDHFRQAIALNPKSLRPRYSLVAALERQGGADSERLIQEQLDAMLDIDPKNLALTLDAVRLAVKRNDAPRARLLTAQLSGPAKTWPARAQKQLDALMNATLGDNLRQAATQVVLLRNLLVVVPAFRDSLAAIQSSTQHVGEPIEHFLTLPQPRSEPAPPDEQVDLGLPGNSLPAPQGVGTIAPVWMGRDGPPVLWVAATEAALRADGKEPQLPFPAGDKPRPPRVHGLLGVDWKNQFKSGLVMAGGGGLLIYQQLEDGRFADVTDQAVHDHSVVDRPCIGVWAADLDLDGDLDLVAAPVEGEPIVLRNNSDGTFTPIHPFAGVGSLRDFLWIDLDGDGVPDAVLLDAQGAVHLLINQHGAVFKERQLPPELSKVTAIAAGDVTGDGLFRLVCLRPDGQIVRLDGDKLIPLAQVKAPPEARLMLADVDANGALDLLVCGNNSTLVLLSDGKGYKPHLDIAANVLAAAVLDPGSGLELLGLRADGNPVRIKPKGSKGYSSQTLAPRAKQTSGDGRINSFGIGGDVELRSGLLVQHAPIDAGSVYFGLGDHKTADAARIVWSNGSNQAEFSLKPDQLVVAEQRLKGSCPMLFAWDEKRMQFVTDLIWRSPLGLRINAQATAAAMQTQDWVKVSGDQLVAHDGYYDLRITAELWETHYFDHVSLMAVDHPADTEAFVDERFARMQPPLAVQLTTPPHPFPKVIDEKGQDVTSLVAARDGRYEGDFAKGAYQGIAAADHFVEIEVPPDAPTDQPLALLAFGWVHPTDSSINYAIAQGDHTPPRSLSIAVPDGGGGWRVARDAIGFPSGKNKTIVLPLEGLWKPGERRRLRLVSNLEIYWDSLAWATLLDSDATRNLKPDEGKPSSVHAVRLPAARAELVYRGFSKIEAADDRSPELPDYQTIVGTMPRWPDLAGFYTRYGDVRPLLEKIDDRYVIMNAGDELRLRFPELPPPAPGWRRDFVVIADGWEKDGDFNTAFGTTVLPLPRHDWPAYDAMPQSLADDPIFQRHPEDWIEYHTRYVTPEAYQRAIRPHRGD